jgi:hypothetical protein
MANVSLTKVKALTTASEYALVIASRRPQLGLLGAAELKKNVTKARRLRDKWRDQATRQRRDTQQRHGARVADGEERSVLKAEVFGAALSAFEAQLAKVEASGAAGGRALKKKPTKAARAQKHRLSRAIARESMEAERESLSPPRKKVATKATKKTKASKKTATKGTTPQTAKSPKASTKKAGSKKTAKKAATGLKKAPTKSLDSMLNKLAKKVAKKKTAKAVRLAPEATAAVGPSSPPPTSAIDPKKQLRASAAGKKSRLDRSGFNSRVKGHVSASGRRTQGRRDSRG